MYCLSQNWDKAENIPDPDAKKPEDWDEDMDGEWEPPMIPNPEYKVHHVACRAFITSTINAMFPPISIITV